MPEFRFTKAYYVYAVLCQDGEGPGYIKIGYSGNIGSRLSGIKSNSPIPAKYFCTVEIGSNKNKAMAVESALLKQFEGRNTTGEWFRFDFNNPEDKRDFNEGCRRVFAYEIGPDYEWWTKISVEEYEKYVKERTHAFLNSKNRNKIVKKQSRMIEYRKRWLEYNSYRHP